MVVTIKRIIEFSRRVPIFLLSLWRMTDWERYYFAGETKDYFRYKGYLVHWTGWKESQSSDELCAQWVAYPVAYGKGKNQRTRDKSRKLIYSSVPGRCSSIYEGELFDLTREQDQIRIIYNHTPDCLRRAAQIESLVKLFKCIDETEEDRERERLVTQCSHI